MTYAYLAHYAAARQLAAPDITGDRSETGPEPIQFHAPIVAAPTIASICRDVAEKYGITVRELESTSSVHRIAHPRQEVMWRARQLRRWDGTHRYSYPMIARFWRGKGGRPPDMGYDHTSIMAGCASHEKRQRLNLLKLVANANAQSARVHGVQA